MALTFCDDLESAGKKFCPMVANADAITCCTDSCMAWRWVETNIKGEDGSLEPTYDTHGYCGMATDPT